MLVLGRFALFALAVCGTICASAYAQVGTHDISGEPNVTLGSRIYERACAQCHEGQVPRAPLSLAFQMMDPRTIYDTLTVGVMREQGKTLDEHERLAVAEYLAAAEIVESGSHAQPLCDSKNRGLDFNHPPRLRGWGMTAENTRFIEGPTAAIHRSDVGRLKIKWAFAFPGATRARSQPMVAGRTVFVGSQDGTVYALDLESGCIKWVFQADAEVRTGFAIDEWEAGDDDAIPLLYFGDLTGQAYAVHAGDGSLRWKVRPDAHPELTITGSPRLFERKVYVPMSSREWLAAGDDHYECCTFRGGVAALDAATGAMLWKTYSIEAEPAPTGRLNRIGVPTYAPSGAPVWNSPTIDVKRRRLYVGTGESYSSPAADTSDAVLALDLDTGELIWHYQSLADDAWNFACLVPNGANCPEERGPDLDIGAPPVLLTLGNGKDVLMVGQKSSEVFALDPDASGRLLWKKRLGRGGFVGGVHWGMAAAGEILFAPNADTSVTGKEIGKPKPGLYAIDAQTGEYRWTAPAPQTCSSKQKPGCDPGLSAPPTVIPGVVFSGSFDGHIRAYDSNTGQIIWDYDTTQNVNTVSGYVATGGSLESAGPVIFDGYVLVTSGYMFGGRMPGNVLLTFTVGGR